MDNMFLSKIAGNCSLAFHIFCTDNDTSNSTALAESPIQFFQINLYLSQINLYKLECILHLC